VFLYTISGDEIVWHVANAAKRRFIDQLVCSYRVGPMAYISGSVTSYSKALWSELSDRDLAKEWGCCSLLLCVCYVIVLW